MLRPALTAYLHPNACGPRRRAINITINSLDTDLDKLRTNPAMANPTLAARMQPKIAEREAEVAALTAEVAALQRAAGSS